VSAGQGINVGVGYYTTQRQNTHGTIERKLLYPFSINIFRLEEEQKWSLEVVDQDNTSHVWEDQFASDSDARDAAVHAIETEGALAFIRGNNVIPFRQQ
jgi:hypothetical protein